MRIDAPASVRLPSSRNRPCHDARTASSSFFACLPLGKSQTVSGRDRWTATANKSAAGATARAVILSNFARNEVVFRAITVTFRRFSASFTWARNAARSRRGSSSVTFSSVRIAITTPGRPAPLPISSQSPLGAKGISCAASKMCRSQMCGIVDAATKFCVLLASTSKLEYASSFSYVSRGTLA